MADVVLHVGTHKTGTTALQDTFCALKEELAEEGLIYPQFSERVTGHHGLCVDWIPLPKPYHLNGSSADGFRDLARRYAEKPGTLFLSSEEFSRANPESSVDLATVRALLSDFERIRVICTLRPPWQFLQSIYAEWAKGKRPLDLAEMVAAVLRTSMVDGLWIDYARLLDRLEAVFAPEEIVLVDYATAAAAPGRVPAYVLRLLGFEAAADEIAEVGVAGSNVSPPALSVWAAHAITQPKFPPRAMVDIATQTLSAYFDAPRYPSLFSRGELQRIEAHLAPGLAALETRRQPYQPGWRLTGPTPADVDLTRDQVEGRFWLHLARTLSRHYALHERSEPL